MPGRFRSEREGCQARDAVEDGVTLALLWPFVPERLSLRGVNPIALHRA